jgi:hypothetical protein
MERTSKMRAALLVALILMLSCAVLQGAERGFDDIVRAISEEPHTRPLHVPFLGLVNVATFVARPAGVKHLDLALFDNLDLDDHAVRGLAETLGSLGGNWHPFVRVRGHGETVLVYMAQERNEMPVLSDSGAGLRLCQHRLALDVVR